MATHFVQWSRSRPMVTHFVQWSTIIPSSDSQKTQKPKFTKFMTIPSTPPNHRLPTAAGIHKVANTPSVSSLGTAVRGSQHATRTKYSPNRPVRQITVATTGMSILNMVSNCLPSAIPIPSPGHAKVSVSRHNNEPDSKETTTMQKVLSHHHTFVRVLAAHYTMHTMQLEDQVFDARSTHLKNNHNLTP